MEKGFSLTYSDPWGLFDSCQGVSRLMWALHNRLRKVRGWATVPMVTQRAGREIGAEEAGFSGVSLNTRSYIIVHSYTGRKEIRIDVGYREEVEILDEELILYLEKILPKLCKLKKRNPEPCPGDAA